ncbi:MAG: hypothetical protein QM204_06575 [Bacillota bacterium]|nr:hypothetical protein [Bacillota bacterium]NLL26325.1 hypothetical protein [Erysipelotrichia bacterium]
MESHEDFANKIYKSIEDTDKKEYKIITKDGKDYEKLSPGWKSAVILDLILGYENNSAPIIIDQPEDNLATDYINHDLIDMIKKIKEDKQIILVSHNATIPMLGDAQNVIICENNEGKIFINSAALESEVKDKKTLDWIAELTDYVASEKNTSKIIAREMKCSLIFIEFLYLYFLSRKLNIDIELPTVLYTYIPFFENINLMLLVKESERKKEVLMSYIRNEENHKYLKREARKVANELNKVSIAQKEQLMNNWSKIIELIKKHGYEELVDVVIKSDKC